MGEAGEIENGVREGLTLAEEAEIRELAADGVPVTVTCRVLQFTPHAYYKWRANPVSSREWSDAHLVDRARDVHADDPDFGYRFITDELASEHCITASENRVHLCA